MKALVIALLVLAGVINIIPLSGVLSGARLEALYGVTVSEPNLLIMMRHRAVVLGMVGALLLTSIFMPRLRLAACIAGLVSMTSYLAIALLSGGYNAALERVVLADVVAVAALFAVLAIDRPTS